MLKLDELTRVTAVIADGARRADVAAAALHVDDPKIGRSCLRIVVGQTPEDVVHEIDYVTPEGAERSEADISSIAGRLMESHVKQPGLVHVEHAPTFGHATDVDVVGETGDVVEVVEVKAASPTGPTFDPV